MRTLIRVASPCWWANPQQRPPTGRPRQGGSSHDFLRPALPLRAESSRLQIRYRHSCSSSAAGAPPTGIGALALGRKPARAVLLSAHSETANASPRTRILPALGGAKLGDIRRSDVQRVVNRMMADGLEPSTVRNALMPLRAIYRQALALEEVAINPTTGVQLPAVRGKRERIASPAEAASLLDALPSRDRAVWATALYAGLRSGELQALTDELIDLDANVIRVQWSWDPKAGRVAPKSRAGQRTVPVPSELRKHLLEHRLARGPAVDCSSGARMVARSQTRRSASGRRAAGRGRVSSRSACTSVATPSPR